MFKQPRLIMGIDADFAETQGKKESRMYERLCGKLQLEDIFTTDSVYICAPIPSTYVPLAVLLASTTKRIRKHS